MLMDRRCVCARTKSPRGTKGNSSSRWRRRSKRVCISFRKSSSKAWKAEGVKGGGGQVLNDSLKELATALAQKKISSVELTRLFLNRIEKLNPALNAFITVDVH